MDKNLGEKIAEQLIEQSAKTIGLYPGGFKPSHRGHFEVAKRAAQHVDELHIIISNNIREGYTPKDSLKIWELYKKILPENVKIKIAVSPSPITEIYSIVKDKTNDYIVIYGKGEKDRYNSINENREKYSNVDIIDAGNIDNISATELREAIRSKNKLAIKSLIPEGIKVDDFLMNFQIHEIKVNNPNHKTFEDVYNLRMNIIKQSKTIKKGIYSYPHSIGIIDDILDKYGDVFGFRTTKDFIKSLSGDNLTKLYQELKSLDNIISINEIKVNTPGFKSVIDVINLIKQIREKYRTLQINDQLYYINKIEDIKDKYGDVIAFRNTKEFLEALPEKDLNKIYKEYESLLNLNEIKINNPSKPLLFKANAKLDDDMYDGTLYYQNKPIEGVIYIGKNNNMGVPEELSIPTSTIPKEIKQYTKELTSFISGIDLSKVSLDLNEEKIPGGLSSGLTLQDIADKHKVNISILRKQLQKGIKVELEHTTSKQVAEEIAMDHLVEDPKYYDKLASIEEIKVNQPGKISYQEFEDLLHSIKYQTTLSDILEEFGYDMSGDSIPTFYDRVKDTPNFIKLVGIMNKMEKRPLDEAKQLDNVYHFTNLNGLQGILSKNKFESSITEVDKFNPDFRSFRKKESDYKDRGIEDVNYFSLTRNKDLHKKDPKIRGSLVRIKIDGTKLSQNYKVQPFYYYSDEIDNKNTHPKIESDESEERVNLGTKTEIPNALKYIQQIDVFLDKVGDNIRVLDLIKDLQIKYPQIKIQYKGQEMSIDDYKSNILPNIEPYHSIEEKFLKQLTILEKFEKQLIKENKI